MNRETRSEPEIVGAAAMAGGARRGTWGPWWAPLMVAMAAVGLALCNFPARYDCREPDELFYLGGSLEVMEGVAPAMKAAPAGAQTWVGWFYLGGVAARNFVRPDEHDRGTPWTLRPFLAVDRTLFDTYRDMSTLRSVVLGVAILIFAWSAVGMYRVGWVRGGVGVGIFGGLLVAVLPMFIDYACMARSYSLGWSFAILAISTAAIGSGQWRIWGSAIFLGLAIGSRIDLIGMAPLVLWQFWDRREGTSSWRATAVRVLAGAAVVTMLSAPWLLEHAIGNLRTIATVRVISKPGTGFQLAKPLTEFLWEQGLAGVFAIFLGGIFLASGRGRWKQIILGLYTLLLLGAILQDDGYGLRHQGPSVVTFLFGAVVAAGSLHCRLGRWAGWVACAALLLPLAQSVRLIAMYRADALDDAPVKWVEDHVKPGTMIYENGIATVRSLVPTAESGEFLWTEVTDSAAWRAKFQSGLQRFHLSADEYPRALSEENMVQDRGMRRSFFILGGGPHYAGPRFNLRVAGLSPVFTIKDFKTPLGQTGGLVFSSHELEELGTPRQTWSSISGARKIYIYYNDESILNSSGPATAHGQEQTIVPG